MITNGSRSGSSTTTRPSSGSMRTATGTRRTASARRRTASATRRPSASATPWRASAPTTTSRAIGTRCRSADSARATTAGWSRNMMISSWASTARGPRRASRRSTRRVSSPTTTTSARAPPTAARPSTPPATPSSPPSSRTTRPRAARASATTRLMPHSFATRIAGTARGSPRSEEAPPSTASSSVLPSTLGDCSVHWFCSLLRSRCVVWVTEAYTSSSQ
mmetsp:Transcript_17435/g.70056  ORF Transcript_17435/g.70056 Transcript_17435/m.70056 type:complete len:220 (+) Transcript_17435:493-1152(+)